MFIPLSILPMVLLVHSVTTADLYNYKRVPRRHTEVIRTYKSNHPPLVENYDIIPVTVIYDDQEEIKGRNSNAEKVYDIIQDENDEKENENANGKATNLETLSVNHPPIHDIPAAIINDYEEEISLKPKVRFIRTKARLTELNEEESDKLKILSDESGHKKLRRRSQVRKVKVNKSQLNTYINENIVAVQKKENTENTAANKGVPKTENDLTHNTEQSLQIPKSQETFKRRKQLRDPVVPIIESESYVLSHSGDYHYSYEGGDGTKAFERGELKSSNGGAGSAVEGNYSYKDKDGNDFSLSYTADENGYRPVGTHLPTPPPIPPAIQRALEYLATKTMPEQITERVKIL